MKSWEREIKMDGYLVHGGLGMGRGASVRIEDGAGINVYIWEGEVWLTQEGDPRDYFVTPGQWFRIKRDGTALLYATRRTHATLTSAKSEDYARLITVTPAGTSIPRPIYRAPRRAGWRERLFSLVFSKASAS
jgi:hypothetical protein